MVDGFRILDLRANRGGNNMKISGSKLLYEFICPLLTHILTRSLHNYFLFVLYHSNERSEISF